MKSIYDWPPGFPLCAAVINKEDFTAIYLNGVLIRAARISASQSVTGRSLYSSLVMENCPYVCEV